MVDMLTMRPFEKDGSWGAKSKKEYILDNNSERVVLKSGEFKSRKVDAVDWNNQDDAEIWWAAWAETANRYLEIMNRAERIDNRSYARQGIDQVPTIHLGAAAHQMEKRGIRTERGDINREIEVTNQNLRQLKARIVKLQNWLIEEMENDEPPTLADVISNILSWREQIGQPRRNSSINNLKAAANILNFLTANNIMDMAGLDDKLKSMISKQFAIRDELKPIEQRLKTLDEHIKQADIYREYRPFKQKYNQQKPKHQEQYYETYRRELTLYEAAERYIKGVLNGRDKIPLPTWKTEREKLIAERKQLDVEYKQLKADTAAVEKIRSNVYDIISDERRRTQPQRAQDMER